MIFAQKAIFVFEGHRCNCNIQICDNSKSIIKMGSKGYKWSSLNAPGTEKTLPHHYWKLNEFPISLFTPLAWAHNRNWPPNINLREMKNCQSKLGLRVCKRFSLYAFIDQYINIIIKDSHYRQITAGRTRYILYCMTT